MEDCEFLLALRWEEAGLQTTRGAFPPKSHPEGFSIVESEYSDRNTMNAKPCLCSRWGDIGGPNTSGSEMHTNNTEIRVLINFSKTQTSTEHQNSPVLSFFF